VSGRGSPGCRAPKLPGFLGEPRAVGDSAGVNAPLNFCNTLNCTTFAEFCVDSAPWIDPSDLGSISAVSTILEEAQSFVSKGVAILCSSPPASRSILFGSTTNGP
jgi:hypothetical protein